MRIVRNKRFSKSHFSIFIMVVIMLIQGNIAFADNNPNISSSEMESFSNDFFQKYMDKYNVPGAAVVIVHNGEIVFKKGYGYSNLEKKLAVIPDKTAFRIGSVGKLFTQTAIMQLYEKGSLKLNDDVNKDLKAFKINNNFSKPVTYADLLTHTSGIDEEGIVGISSKNKPKENSYEEYMKNHIPTVVDEPGKLSRYSNIGTDLLGYLVQEKSGISYQKYIENNIFKPLQMKNSRVSIPLEDMSLGYMYVEGKYIPQPYDFYFSQGAGDINSTPTDMANFMIAHLEDGLFNGNRILTNNTVQEMHKQHFTNNPKLPGMCYGFVESYRDGQRIIKHEGAVASGFTSSLFLVPNSNLGVFVTMNTLGPAPLYFEDEFMDHFYGNVSLKSKEPTPENLVDFKKIAKEYVGSYRDYEELSKTKLYKYFGIFPGSESKVTNNGDGTLTLRETNFKKEEVTTRLFEIDPLLFQREDNQGYIAFKRDTSGKIAYMYNDLPFASFEKLKWYEVQELHWIVLGICLLIFLVTPLLWSVRFIISRIRNRNDSTNKGAKVAHRTAGIACVLNFVCLIGIFLVSAITGVGFSYGLPVPIVIMLAGLIVASLLSIFQIVFLIQSLRKKYWSVFGRIHYFIVTLASLIFILFLNYWNLLGFKI